MYDIVIIGAGVVGGMIARTLAQYELKVCVLEKNADVATGASCANSGIVHAGFDAAAGSRKARLNVRGAAMMEQTARELGVRYHRNGSLVLGFCDADRKTLAGLLKRGQENGVAGLRLVEQNEAQRLEPNLTDSVRFALYAPSGAIVCPYSLAIAAIGNAMDNGVELMLDFAVEQITKKKDGYSMRSGQRCVEARAVVNAAGLYADRIARMAGDKSFTIRPRRGEYLLLDSGCGGLITHTIFQPPTAAGKGVLVTPTVDGNLLLGPTSEPVADKENHATTAAGLEAIRLAASKCIAEIPFAKKITSFCGLRAAGSTGDFIINEPAPGFFNAAGIESPGLSAAPAIAEEVVGLIRSSGTSLIPKTNFNPHRRPADWFRGLPAEEKNQIIHKNPAYGTIVCRCESVSEGEILEAIHENPRACTVDAVKRRTRGGMGRCQGGFCLPHVAGLLAQEQGATLDGVTKCGGASHLTFGRTKEGLQ